MKKISFLINQKEKVPVNINLDDKTVFYLFGRIIKQEYGNQGFKNLKPTYLQNKRLFIRSESSIFANELLLNKNEIIRKINQEIGSREIFDLKIN